MFTLHAFSATTSAATSLTNVAPLSDPVLATSGNFLYVPTLLNLIGVYAGGANVERIQLQSPSLLALAPFEIEPTDESNLPTSPLPILFQEASPIPLVTDEPLQCLYTQTSSGVVQAFIFLSDGALAPVTGKIIHARATFTTTGTADSWQNATLSLDSQLAEGTYQLVGCRAQGAHLKAVRFVFPQGTNAVRPGCIAATDDTNFDAQHLFRNGRLGVWGTFTNRVLPTIDHVNDGTTETAVLILDLIKSA